MRSFSISRITDIANDPDVRPYLGGDGPLDFSKLVQSPRNYLFEIDIGGFWVINRFGTIYEVHTIFSPKKKGVHSVLELMRDASDFMFTMTDCSELVTKIPDGNLGAGWLARIGNFKKTGRLENWAPGKGADIMSFHLDTWASLCSTPTRLAGALYDQLNQAKGANDRQLIGFSNEQHQHILGATLQMMVCGNVAKGVDLYNNWALRCGLPLFDLLSGIPPVVDIHDAIIGVEGQEVKVMLCR